MCRKKCCICLIPELASAEYSQSAFFTIFASKSARMKYFLVFCLKKVFFTIVDLGKSKHSESFGPPFQKQNFFPRKTSGVLWGPPEGSMEVGPITHLLIVIRGIRMCRKKILLVSFLNWHQQNIPNLRYSPFSHQNQPE